MTRNTLEIAKAAALFHLRCNREVFEKKLSTLDFDEFAARSEFPPIVDGIVAWANAGDGHAIDACLHAASEKLLNGQPLVPSLAQFLGRQLQETNKIGKRRRGQSPRKNRARDLAISVAVFAASKDKKVPATRSPASRGRSNTDSACSLVRQLLEDEFHLHLTEDAIEKIWKSNKD
jgi:hypothetical protein